MALDRVAVIPSIGIGDGLIMMVVSHRLYCQGFVVTTFSKPLVELQKWFQGHTFVERPSLDLLESVFAPFDLIVLQNDNSPFAKKLISLYQEGKLKALSIFYPSYEEAKHTALSPIDRVFNENRCMVDNAARAISSLLGLNHFSKNNGFILDETYTHRRYKNRVLFHPTSLDEKRNWPPQKFLQVATTLQNQGFQPVFSHRKGRSSRQILRFRVCIVSHTLAHSMLPRCFPLWAVLWVAIAPTMPNRFG